MDGSYEPVAEISAELERLAAGGGPDVPIHVDVRLGRVRRPLPPARADLGLPAPPGGPDQRPGHKYGLVYPGVGWVAWRTPDAPPEDLVFKVNYLGGKMPCSR